MLEQVSFDRPSAGVANGSESALAERIDYILARLRRGERIDIEAETAACPDWSESLRALWPTLQALAVAGGGTQDAGSSVAALSTSPIQNPIPARRDKTQNAQPLGDFELLREVGRGGMGIVYEARQVSLGRRVAVKILPAASLLDERQLQRFQNEARAAAQLNHPHIVDVICVGCDQGVHYFAMRFIEGRTLADLSVVPGPSSVAADHGPLTTNQAALWIAQAAEALEHAHTAGIVHRDIKPSNLLIDNDGKLWVTDFGVARFGEDAGLTLTGDLLGTLRYMSPEQALGRLAAVGPRSDVYSLGATLYELLASRPVFTGDDRGELLRQVAFEQPAPLRKLVPRLPRDLETIAHKALEKSPDDRYASAGEMAADLRRHSRGEPIFARPPTLAERAVKWCLRNARVATAAAALLLLAVIGLLASTLLISRSRDDAVAAQKLAEDRDLDNRRMLSIMQTGLAMQAYQQGDLAQARELLNRAAPDLSLPLGEGRGEGTVLPLPPHPQASTRGRGEGTVLPLPPGEGRGEGGSQQNRRSHPQTTPTSSAAPPHPNPLPKGEGTTANDFRSFAWHWLDQSIEARIPELKSFDNHPSDVYKVAYSPDGTLLAAATLRRIILRDAKTGETRRDIAAHQSDVNWLDFSPDGALLASVGDDCRVRLWHVASGELAADVGKHDCQISSVAFSPDGRRLATGDEHGLMIIWDVANRREEKRLVKHTDRIRKLAFAADGTLVNISLDWYLTAWNVDTAEPRWRFAAPYARFNSVALSPDGKTVAAGDGLGIVFLLDLTEGTVLGRMGPLNGAVDDLAFSPDSRLLAAGGDDKRVRFWDLARQTCLGQTPAQGDRVWSVALSPDGRTLATGTRDRIVKLWDVEAFCRPRQLDTRDEGIGLAFSTDNTLAVASNDELWIWPRAAMRPRKLFWPAETGFVPLKRVAGEPTHRGGGFAPHGVAWFGKDLVLQDTTGALWLATPGGGCRRWMEGPGQSARIYSFSPDRRWLAVLGRTTLLEIWNSGSRQLVSQPSKRNFLPQFSPDGRCFYTWRESQLLRWPLPGADAAAASPSGAAVLGEPQEILRRDGDLDPVAISADGRTLLLGYSQLLDLPTLRLTSLVGQATPFGGQQAPLNCAAFSPDGRTLATGRLDGTTSLWDVVTGQRICTLDHRPDGEIRTIVFSPDGKSLAAAGRDRAGGSVTVWELK